MSVITPGTTFANGEQLTASDLNLLVQGASFSQNAVDNNTTILVGSAITVADGGITNAKLGADAVTTSKILDGDVTKAKIENFSGPLKVLGRMSAGAGAVEDVEVISDDELVGASAITLATSASIKAYVDTSSGIVQSALAENGAQLAITASIPADSSTPKITEGVQIFSLTMTPKSISNRMKVLFSANILNLSATQYTVVALFEGNTCVGASTWTQASNGLAPISLQFYFNPSSTSETVYTMRLGPNSGTCYFNGNGSSPTLGGFSKAKFYIEELSV